MDHDWRTVALDVTRYYTLRDGDEKSIRQILDVYMYDASEHTFCCESTPSYHMIHLYTTIVYADDVSDAARERMDSAYAYFGADNCYLHVSDVERMPILDSYGQDAEEEEAREFWLGNPPV